MSAYETPIPIITKGFRKALSVAHQFAHHSKREYTLPRLHPGKDVAVRCRLKPCDPRPDLGNASVEHGNAFEFFADALAGDPPLDAAGPGCTGERAIDHHGMERIADFRPALQFAPLAFSAGTRMVCFNTLNSGSPLCKTENRRVMADKERFIASKRSKDSALSFEEAVNDASERRVEKLAEKADMVIDTARHTERDVFCRVSARLNLQSRSSDRVVDVLVGGQYGSEGKGNIADFLAPEYEVLMRVGGPNAGHRVFEEPPYTHI